MKEFNLNAALEGAPVCTRDGRRVTNILVTDPTAPTSAHDASLLELKKPYTDPYRQGIQARIHNLSFSDEYSFYHDGGSHRFGLETCSDLKMVADE